MAGKARVNPLSQGAVEELAAKSSGGKTLPSMVLPLDTGSSSGEYSSACVVHLVYVRSGGFLIAAPANSDVHAALVHLTEDLSEAAAFTESQILVETARGAPLGATSAEMVDLPWETVGAFFPSSAQRSNAFKQSQMVQFEVGSKVGRPVRTSAEDAANSWIESHMDPATAAEYQTALSLQN